MFKKRQKYPESKYAYVNVVLDTHQYLMMAEASGCLQKLDAYLDYIKEHYEKVQKHFPVICGGWCLFNSLACGWDTKGGQGVLNGMEGTDTEQLNAAEKKEIYRALAKAQLAAWEKGSGYFY